VLLAFVGPRPDGTEAAHEDGDPANNRLGNLSWKTPKANQSDRVKHGTANRGSRHGCAKLTEADVLALRAGELGTPKEAAERLGVDLVTIYNARNGKTWKHIPVGA
jgi:hypothetical protein